MDDRLRWSLPIPTIRPDRFSKTRSIGAAPVGRNGPELDADHAFHALWGRHAGQRCARQAGGDRDGHGMGCIAEGHGYNTHVPGRNT